MKDETFKGELANDSRIIEGRRNRIVGIRLRASKGRKASWRGHAPFKGIQAHILLTLLETQSLAGWGFWATGHDP